jgi:hypothetical protein
MIEGLYDRAEQIPDFSVESIRRASLTPAFSIRIVPEATQAFLDLWDLRVRKDVGFHLSKRSATAVSQPVISVDDNVHFALDTNVSHIDLSHKVDHDAVIASVEIPGPADIIEVGKTVPTYVGNNSCPNHVSTVGVDSDVPSPLPGPHAGQDLPALDVVCTGGTGQGAETSASSSPVANVDNDRVPDSLGVRPLGGAAQPLM